MKKVFLSGLVAGIAMSLVSAVCNILWQQLLPGLEVQYQTPLFRPWSDPLMSLIFVVPVLSGFVMAKVWSNAGSKICLFSFCLPGNNSTRKNIFGFASVFILMSIIGMLMTYSCFPISFLMLVTWCVSMIAQYLIGIWVLTKMIK